MAPGGALLDGTVSVPRLSLPPHGPLPASLLHRLRRATAPGTGHQHGDGATPSGIHTAVVGVDGRSGAGKTTLAARLAADLGWRVLALEEMYQGWHGLAGTPSRLCRDVLAPIAAGRPGHYRRYDWHAGRPSDTVTVAPGGVLLVEGVGVLAAPCADRFRLRLWLEAPTSQRRSRALARDGRGYEPWWPVWAQQEEGLLGPVGCRPAADLVLDTTDPPATPRGGPTGSAAGTGPGLGQ